MLYQEIVQNLQVSEPGDLIGDFVYDVQQRLTVARYITWSTFANKLKKNQPHSHALCDAGGDENCMIFSFPS